MNSERTHHAPHMPPATRQEQMEIAGHGELVFSNPSKVSRAETLDLSETNPVLKDLLIKGKAEGKTGWLLTKGDGSQLCHVNAHLQKEARKAGLDLRSSLPL